MIQTDTFVGTEIAEAKIAEIRRQLGGKVAICRVVRDSESGSAMAYATRLVTLGSEAGITVVEMGYTQLEDLLADTAQDPVIFLHPAPVGVDVASLIETLGASRDAEGLHPLNAGKLTLGVHQIAPPTAQAALIIAQHLAGSLSGKRITIVGASNIVGLPLAQLLIHEGATVRVAQESTLDLLAETCDADVVISATGVPGLIGADHIAQGAFVIDVGITRVAGKLVGDVNLETVLGKAAAVTHVPDGVGPITAACLFENILMLSLTHSSI